MIIVRDYGALVDDKIDKLAASSRNSGGQDWAALAELLANLKGANLKGANLTEANLKGANLVEANLQEANLQEANLQEADLAIHLGSYMMSLVPK